jgi:hypothetical protein
MLKAKSSWLVKPPFGITLDRGDSLTDGEVATWLLNEGGGDLIFDQAGSAAVSASANVAFGDAKSGSGVVFNGSNTAFTLSPIANITDNVSIACWVYPNGINANWIISGGTVNGFWQLFFELNNITYRTNTGGAPSLTYAAATGAWVHIVAGQEGTNGFLYVNGVLQASGTVNAIPAGGANTYIGAYAGGPGEYTFSGTIDYIRVWNRKITENEIARLYNNPHPGILSLDVPIGIMAPAGGSPVFNDAWDVKTPIMFSKQSVVSSGFTTSDLINR